jgi:hypothetical protein
MVEVASATIVYGIRAKRAQVQDPAYTILEAKKKIPRSPSNPRQELK